MNRKICIAGKNQIAAECLVFTVARFGAENILFLPAQGDLNSNTWQPFVTKLADDMEVDIVTLEDIFSLKNLIFFSLEFDSIIDTRAFASQHLFNLHFSYLPFYRGVYTSVFPILDDAQYTGVTLHVIDNGIDSGPIVDQDIFDIPRTITSRELYMIYTRKGVDLFKRNVDTIIEQESIHSFPQNASSATSFRRTDFSFESVEIDPSSCAENIIRFIRATSFPEYQLPTYQGRKIIFSDISTRKKLRQGEFYFVSKNALYLGTKCKDILLVLSA